MALAVQTSYWVSKFRWAPVWWHWRGISGAQYWGRLQKDKQSKVKALQQIKLHLGSLYDPQLVLLLEQLVLTMDDTLTDQAVHPLTTAKLQPGMRLLQALYNDKAMLLLPEGHIFSISSIMRIRQLEQKTSQHFALLIKARCQSLQVSA